MAQLYSKAEQAAMNEWGQMVKFGSLPVCRIRRWRPTLLRTTLAEDNQTSWLLRRFVHYTVQAKAT